MLVMLLGGLTLWSSGCGKEEKAAEPTPAAPQTSIAPAQPQVGAPAPSQAAAQPQLSQIKAAMDAREYDQAAESLLALQRTQLTAQQAAAAAAQMQKLQQNLAGAVASGDPKAIAAAQRLRQASLNQ